MQQCALELSCTCKQAWKAAAFLLLNFANQCCKRAKFNFKGMPLIVAALNL